MNCKSCGQPIIIKRTLKTFATPNIHCVCNQCFKKLKNNQPLIVIPSHEGLMYIYELLYETNAKAEYFYSYLYPYIISFLAYQGHYTLLIFDELDSKTLDLLTHLSIGDMIVLTIKIKGEMNYEL